MPETKKPSRWLFRVLAMGLGIAVALVIGEFWIRDAPPPPHRQIVRTHGLRMLGDDPVWSQDDDRVHSSCIRKFPDRIRVLFDGSSITYGAGLKEPEVFTTLLEDHLNQIRPDPGFCVINLAQPGFAFGQKFALAKEYVPQYHPALIMWEDWRYEWGRYKLLGDAAYYMREFKLRPDGFPGLFGVPDSTNEWMFLHSRLYQWVTMGIGQMRDMPSDQDQGAAFATDDLPKVEALASSVGAKLVVYLGTGLDQPFQDPTPVLDTYWEQPIEDAGKKAGFPVYPLQKELVGQDYMDIRLDPCCHFNAKGHKVLAPIFERMILDALGAKAPQAAQTHPG